MTIIQDITFQSKQCQQLPQTQSSQSQDGLAKKKPMVREAANRKKMGKLLYQDVKKTQEL